MSLTTETAVLRDDAGVALPVQDGVALPAGTPALHIAVLQGGTTTQFASGDASGNQIMVGAGVAGTPSGGVVTVQGDPAGTPIPVTQGTSSTATRTTAAVTNVVSTALASNANRKAATFYNSGTAAVFLALGAGATTTDFTARLQNNDYYEVPGNYTGAITAITASGTANLRVTELT